MLNLFYSDSRHFFPSYTVEKSCKKQPSMQIVQGEGSLVLAYLVQLTLADSFSPVISLVFMLQILMFLFALIIFYIPLQQI